MEKWKIIQSYDSQENFYSYELYDLEKDPKELNSLAEKLTKEAEQLKAKLKDYTSSCDKIRRLILGENFIDKPITLDEDTKEILRQLGGVSSIKL